MSRHGWRARKGVDGSIENIEYMTLPNGLEMVQTRNTVMLMVSSSFTIGVICGKVIRICGA